ncbi:MAG: hypothetical protein HKUEN02_08730 [Anaerolineaceae bacterium]|nr:MAG: hypothetical protein HKUEN02_08730 [Anaerolineaceae bacterium]
MSDEFDFEGRSSKPRGGMRIWDLLSALALLATVGLAAYFGLIFVNPESSLNILPPGRAGFGLQSPTPTITPIQLEPTWTPSSTPVLTATSTLRPTFTPVASDTPISLYPPTRTPKPTSTPKAQFTASVSQVASTIIYPDLLCGWTGIGGTVVDAKNSPIIGQVIVLRGSLDNKLIEQQTVSGINKPYGESGFEFALGNVPFASSTLYIQLVDLNGLPLSDKVAIKTSEDCSKNLVLVRFKKNQ